MRFRFLATLAALFHLVLSSTACDGGAEYKSLTVLPASPVISTGSSLQLTVLGVTDKYGTEDVTDLVEYTSANPAVATVETLGDASPGRVQGLAEGTARIRAKELSSGLTAEITVTVTSASLARIDVSPSQVLLARGMSHPFGATAVYSDGRSTDITASAEWSSSDESVLSVSNFPGEKGLATARNRGVAEVRASFGGMTGTAHPAVSDATLVSLTVGSPELSVPAGMRGSVAAIGTFSDGVTRDLTSSVTWTSSDPDVARVLQSNGRYGEVEALMHGTTRLTAFDPASGRSASLEFVVDGAVPASISIQPVGMAVAVLAQGESASLRARIRFTDGTERDATEFVAWSSSSDATVGVNPVGAIQAVAQGEALVTASLGALSASLPVRVTEERLVGLEISPAAVSVRGGDTVAFTAQARYSGGGVEDVTSRVNWSYPSLSFSGKILNEPGLKGLFIQMSDFSNLPALVTATLGERVATATVTPTGTASGCSLSMVLNPEAPVSVGEQLYAEIQVTCRDSSNRITRKFAVREFCSWSTLQPSIATISNSPGSKGYIIAHAPGTADIRAGGCSSSGLTLGGIVVVTP